MGRRPASTCIKIAKDSFVIGVRNSPAMAWLTGLTKANLKQIYDAQAAISTLRWVDLVPPPAGATTDLIVPRARITGSGSQPDFISQLGVTAASEDATIVATGLPRLVEADQMAQAAENNDNQIIYTSLAEIDTSPGHEGPRHRWPGPDRRQRLQLRASEADVHCRSRHRTRESYRRLAPGAC